MKTVLIIDDESSLVSSLTFALEQEGFKVHAAGTAQAGLRAIAEAQPDLILLDLRLPDRSGLDLLQEVRRDDERCQVIMMSAYGDTRDAVRAVKLGAADYLSKPFDLDDLLHTMRSALERGRMASEIHFHRRSALRTGLVGASEAMHSLSAAVSRVAASGAGRILVLGESGTGKGLVARALHAGSPRVDGPFIEVNCASLPEQLIEAELFGAEKGAYTGAHQRRTGLVTLADRGTLFLDEIGELPLALQSKLLHFLEDGHFRAIGAARPSQADVRVVAATNRELRAEVAAGRFREDLYYRINVISLHVPALRDREGDIALLAEHFAHAYARGEGVAPIRLGTRAQALLAAYRWPGNVRELKNLVERLTILYPGREIGPAELPAEVVAAAPAGLASPASSPSPAAPPAAVPDSGDRRPAIGIVLAETERALLLTALRECAGHKGLAAKRLGLSRHAFKRRLQRLQIE